MQSHRARRKHSRRPAPTVAALVGTLLMILVAAIAASGSPASGGPSSAPAARAAAASPFKVLAVMPISGPLAAVGKTEANGFRSAIKNINANGGILGHPVTLKVVDDAGSGAKAVAAALQESRKGYHLISCGSFGDDGLACAPAIAKIKVLQIPLIAESSLNNPRKYPYLFSPGGMFDPAEQAMVARMKRDGIKKVAVVSGDNTTGRIAGGILAGIARRAGLKVTATVFVPVTTADATPQLQKAKASKPQAIAMTGFTPANGPIIKARTKLGWKVPVYGDVYMSAANLGLVASRSDMRGITLQAYPWSVQGHRATRSHNFKVFWAGYKALDPHPVLSAIAPLTSYNALMMARYAATKARSLDGVKMARVLSRTPDSRAVRGFIGPRALYTPGRHFFGTAPSEFTFVKAGPTVDGLLVPGR